MLGKLLKTQLVIFLTQLVTLKKLKSVVWAQHYWHKILFLFASIFECFSVILCAILPYIQSLLAFFQVHIVVHFWDFGTSGPGCSKPD